MFLVTMCFDVDTFVWISRYFIK